MSEVLKDLENENFWVSFNNIQCRAYYIAMSKGWWDSPREDGTLIALMHSELSEALEALRVPYHANQQSDVIPEFSKVEEELADTIIRIMDFAQSKGLSIGSAIIAKMAYNETRPHKHGGKAF